MVKKLTLDKLFQISPEQALLCQGKTFVGIDFGTSTTVVSVASISEDAKSIKCETLHLRQMRKDKSFTESELLPSVIAKTQNGLLVGQGAYELKWSPDFKFGENLWHSFKMELGKDLGPRWYRSQQSQIKSPQDATKLFFMFLKKVIEEYCKTSGLSSDIHYAVSIPASFESNQRKDLLEALKSNGIALSATNLIDEPNAAFLGYINEDDYYKEVIRIPEDHYPKVLVFDFGAGTCDISILEIGADYKGLNTRNISISQFEELGGNDIDRYIAANFLLPEILNINNQERSGYTDKQLEAITLQLMGVAEKLKIQASKGCSFYLEEKGEMEKAIKSGLSVSVKVPTSIYTDYGDLKQTEFKLSFAQFVETMNAFYKRQGFSWVNLFKTRKRQGSIETVVDSAITKAHIKKSDVDYVMMIGGSSKNPFIQRSLKDSFGRGTEMLIPQNLQSLVSQGAAIHSLLVNGAGMTVVKPITSERIVAVVRGEEELPLIGAGTEIPFSPVVIDEFTTGDREQSVIEIPICVTNAQKMVANIRISQPSGALFPKNERISVTLEMTSDKVLKVSATCAGINYETKTENPFANTFLTDVERKILKAQKESNISANANGGKPTKQALRNLRQAYLDADKSYQAAETIVDEINFYPQDDLYNYIGVLYHNGGDYNKALRYFDMAISVNPKHQWAYSNKGHDLYLIGKYEEAQECLEKAVELKADHTTALIMLGRLRKQRGDEAGAREIWQQAYNILERQWQENQLDSVDYGWFSSLARDLGKFDIARQVEEGRPKKQKNKSYNLDNLIIAKRKDEE